MAESVFVYYYDDYEGGVGFTECDSDESAVAFIENRLKEVTARGETPSLNRYVVIRGRRAKLTAVERIASVRLD